MGSTLKVGLVGTGGIMRNAHMPGWKAAPGVEVVAVCDIDRARAEAFAKDFGVAADRVFTSADELVK
ncbi:MAG: Gfo/Idh/MocA family oxidoreductase, partial [Planctomycetes bacterium]|nr:Gfo/Idh/MocA family oxidoreductase [Planctomycetota bacterium]